MASMVPCRVREALEDDLPSLLSLYAELDQEGAPVLSEEDAFALLARIQSSSNQRIYVATVGGEVVGTFALLTMDNLAHGGAPLGLVESVVVNARMRRQGIGTQMMRFAVAGRRGATS